MKPALAGVAHHASLPLFVFAPAALQVIVPVQFLGRVSAVVAARDRFAAALPTQRLLPARRQILLGTRGLLLGVPQEGAGEAGPAPAHGLDVEVEEGRVALRCEAAGIPAVQKPLAVHRRLPLHLHVLVDEDQRSPDSAANGGRGPAQPAAFRFRPLEIRALDDSGRLPQQNPLLLLHRLLLPLGLARGCLDGISRRAALLLRGLVFGRGFVVARPWLHSPPRATIVDVPARLSRAGQGQPALHGRKVLPRLQPRPFVGARCRLECLRGERLDPRRRLKVAPLLSGATELLLGGAPHRLQRVRTIRGERLDLSLLGPVVPHRQHGDGRALRALKGRDRLGGHRLDLDALNGRLLWLLWLPDARVLQWLELRAAKFIPNQVQRCRPPRPDMMDMAGLGRPCFERLHRGQRGGDHRVDLPRAREREPVPSRPLGSADGEERRGRLRQPDNLHAHAHALLLRRLVGEVGGRHAVPPRLGLAGDVRRQVLGEHTGGDPDADVAGVCCRRARMVLVVAVRPRFEPVDLVGLERLQAFLGGEFA
mmetsp:Transcript_4878/g.11672  ORF Transcript_4878/g.11672 Transcript_4878/m.11672 type:complete len:538 (+) Transcript_4878:2793-4406(+)